MASWREMVPPSPIPDRIAVIVPVAAGDAPPPEVFFERVGGAGGGAPESPIALIAAADSEIPSNVREAFARAGARLHMSSAPRGQRVHEAVSLLPVEEDSILLFLHADTLLPIGWEGAVRRAIASGAVGGAFRLSFSGGGARMRWVTFWANARTAFTRVPYGDQAPFVRRDVYEKLGGHKPWPFLDDWDFSRRLRDEGRIEILPDAVETSPRRYLERGVARTVWTNWKILWRARHGERPENLANIYRR